MVQGNPNPPTFDGLGEFRRTFVPFYSGTAFLRRPDMHHRCEAGQKACGPTDVHGNTVNFCIAGYARLRQNEIQRPVSYYSFCQRICRIIFGLGLFYT